MEEILKHVTGELVGAATLIIVVVSGLIELAPIKINPWSWIAKKVGRAINGELIDKVDAMERSIKAMEETADERNAKSARARVLRFGDEILHGTRHSKEHFDNILQDISEYEQYCSDHPKFENDRMQLTIQHIKETYSKCLADHGFL